MCVTQQGQVTVIEGKLLVNLDMTLKTLSSDHKGEGEGFQRGGMEEAKIEH